MSRTRRYLTIFVVLLLIISTLVGVIFFHDFQQPTTNINKADLSSLNYYTEQFPPYNYQENGSLKGITIDLLGQITAEMGAPVTQEQLHLVSWTEAYQTTLNTNNTVLFSTTRSAQREQSFKWAGPISTDKYVFFARWNSPIFINNSEDLRNYRVGVITDDAAVQQLIDAGINASQLVYDTNATNLIEKLSRGDIDLWCYPEMVGRQLSEQVTGNYYSFKVVYSFSNIQAYFAFNKQIPDSTVQAFQKTLDSLKQQDNSGTSKYTKILGQYIPAIGLAQLNYTTEDWAPFNYLKDGQAAGLSVDILQAIFQTMQVNRTAADIHVIPLADAFAQAQKNSSTVVFSIVRNAQREPLYKWVGPFTKSSFVIYAAANKSLTINSDTDLNKYTIGAVSSTIENDLLAAHGYNSSHIINRATPAELAIMLRDGQIDLWATGDLTGRYEMQKAGVDPNAYKIVYVLSSNDFYFIFSQDIPDTMIIAFRHALEIVRNQKDAQGVSAYERIVYNSLGVSYAEQTFSDKAVTTLVDKTVNAIQKDATGTFERINAKQPPYWDPTTPGLYVYVYNTNVTVVANADNIMTVGVNMKGKTDVTGKLYRDMIVEGALANGTGWVQYVYTNPAEPNLYYKTAYYRLAYGNDGNAYIICSGNYATY